MTRGGRRKEENIVSKTPKYFMYFPGNYRWSAAFVNMLGRGAYGGADISELHKIGSAFDAVASDFLKLSQDFEILAGGRNTALVASSSNFQPGPLGTDFLKLDQDFLLLNQAIGGAFPGTAKAIDALLDHSGKPHGDEMHDTPSLLGVNHGSGH